VLGRHIPLEFASFRSLLLREILISRDQVNFHGKVAKIRHKKLPLWVEGAAPVHSSQIVGDSDNILHAGGSEDAVRSQTRQALPAGGSFGIGGGKLLTNERGRSDWEGLSSGGLLLVCVALRNRFFLDLEDRYPGFSIKYKEVASLVALNDDGHI
jgi:hypothetical protein